MFKKIKYIDPKLYLPNGQPDLNLQLEPSDWKSLTPFINDLSCLNEQYIQIYKGALGSYNKIQTCDPFTNTLQYYKSLTFDSANIKIVHSINTEEEPLIIQSNHTELCENIIKGYVYITQSGTYEFSYSGEGYKALLIDDELFLCDQPKESGETTETDETSEPIKGTKELTVGYHKIEFFHRELTVESKSSLLWKKPNDENFEIIKDSFYYFKNRNFEKSSFDKKRIQKNPCIDKNTVLFIPMCGEHPYEDLSNNAYTIQNVGVTTSDNSPFHLLGGSCKFTNRGQYLYINQNVLAGLKTFTIEFDYLMTELPTENTWQKGFYFAANGPTDSGDGCNMRFGNNQIVMGFSSDGDDVGSPYVPDINVWHHFRVTRDENNVVNVYVDGMLLNSYTKSSNFYAGTNYGFAIGRVEPRATTTSDTGFRGNIANYHISNIVRTYSYIDIQPTLIFHAPLIKEAEQAKTNQTITAKGTITYDTVADKQCAIFDGNSFIHSDTVNKVVGGLNKEVCYAAWFRTTDKSASQIIISCTESGGFNLALNPTDAAGYIRAELYANGSYCTIKDYPIDNLENNKWYFVLANYNGSTFDLWLNDTKISSANKTGIIGYPSNSNVKFTIGSEANPGINADQCFKGFIADVRVYNRALTDEQIAQVYAGNLLNYSQNAATLFDIKGKTVSDGYLDITYDFTHDTVYGMSFTNEFINPNDKSNADGRTKENAIPWYNVVNSNNRVHVTDADGISKFYEILLEAGVTYTFRRQGMDYDDASWLWDQNGNELFYDDDEFWRQYTATYTGTYYIEVSHYGRHGGSGAGNTYLYFEGTQPTVPPVLPSIEYLPVIQSTSDKLIFSEKDFSYSFWIYKNANNDPLNGTILELYNTITKKSQLCIYIKNNKLQCVLDKNIICSYNLPQNLFNKRDLNSPFNLIFTKANNKSTIYIDNLNIGSIALGDINPNIITIGNIYDNFDTFNGRIKWFRAYDKALTEDQIASLASQFDHPAGNGDTYINPLGIVPQVFDEDTAYVIRRYEDNTPTYFDIKECKIKSVGFFACPLNAQSISDQLPESIATCPWIGETGIVQLRGLKRDTILNNGTISYFYMDSIELIRLETGTDPMFRFTISDSNSKFIFNKCRFSSNNCELDNLESTKMNTNATRYFLFSSTIGTFMMRDSKIIHTNNYYDAFQIFNCSKAIIRNVEVYSTTNTNHYNGYAFGFIRGNDSFVYDDYWQYLSNAHVEKLDMKNVKMLIRSNADSNSYYIPGLVNAVSNSLLRMENIEIINDPEFDINTPAGSLHNTNGVIAIRTPYDYYVKNITVKLPNSSAVGSHALICFRVGQPGVRSSYTQGKQMYHIIDGIDIQMGNNSASSNSDTERNYFNQTTDNRYLEHYAAFAFFSGGSAHRMHFLRNCSIYAPRSVAIALQYVRAITENITGVIRLYEASINVENHHHIFGSNAIRFWFNGEVNIENLTVDNYKQNNNLISYDSNNSNTNTHVYIKNCNCPIQSINYSKGNSGNNSAFIYCPNTQVENGFYMRGHSNLIIPVDIHRVLGHKVSLRLSMNNYQGTPFRFPPEPYKGLKQHLKRGKRTMTLYFAEAELNKDYTDWITKNLYVQLETSDYIYDSRIDGKWSVDISEWSVDLVKPFKYELTFNLDEAEDVYVKLYYNVETKANGGLFWDPKIGWK